MKKQERNVTLMVKETEKESMGKTMKIEMGESLCYSWLRHIKGCRFAQTNWKASPQWEVENEPMLHRLAEEAEALFETKHQYKIFKKNSSLSQILLQGECDVVGLAIGPLGLRAYAVDVAFHESGLNYGLRDETVMKVLAKCIRSALCLLGYMNQKQGEIFFASPKINPAILRDLEPCMAELNDLFGRLGLGFHAAILANEDFEREILRPLLSLSDGIADTSELFLRSYQLMRIFDKSGSTAAEPPERAEDEAEETAEMKIGEVARTILRPMLETGRATAEEIAFMQTLSYSKQFFDLQFPLLAKEGSAFEKRRYYTEPLRIGGERYYLCSQWFEKPENNDWPYLIAWIEAHRRKA